MAIFLYSRVSSKNSASSGISLEEQIRQGVDYAHNSIPQDRFFDECFGCETRGVFADNAVSGWSKPFLARPAAARLATLIQPGDHIVCYAIDRLARNIRDYANTTEHFLQMGVHLHYITDQINTTTANGKLQANIRAAIAQWYSDIISERVKEAKLIKKLGFTGGTIEQPKKRGEWESAPYNFLTEKAGRSYGTAYRYERVSDISQYTSGLGLECQSQANEAYARRFCAETGSIDGGSFREDAISAFSTPFGERPVGKMLLEKLQPGDDLIIYRGDRAWRNTRDYVNMLEDFAKRGIYVHVVRDGIRTDADSGVDWLAIMVAVAQLESSLKRRRKKEANDWCKKNGRPWNGPPVGWTITKRRGKKRLKFDIEKAAFYVALWLLKHEIGLSVKRVGDVTLAWNCRMKDERLTLKKVANNKITQWYLSKRDIIRGAVSASAWEQVEQAARELIAQPIDPKYWGYLRWSYDKLVLDKAKNLAAYETCEFPLAS